ncbi:Chitinase A1 precursor [Clostridium sp. C105KSO15]|nr:Chitinase A1 precursor [Clostridium sp. C105KSO15]
MNKSIMKKLFLSVSVFMVIILSCYLSRVAFAEKPNRISSEPSQDSTTITAADNPVPLSPKTIADNSETAAVLAAEESDAPPATEQSTSLAAESSALPATEPSNLQSGKLVGYYAAWAAYYNYFPNQIDAGKLTHINYAFADIGSDLKLTLGYPDVDSSNIKLLNSLKQTNPDLKTLISVGGWNWSGKFSDAALTEETRTAFADSCVDFIKKYGFDGVDLDWEYPVSGGLATNARRGEDKHNFTLLLKKIREKLDAQGAADNKHYLLTIAGGADTSYINKVELSKLAQYLDYANLMTYDLHGYWDSNTDLLAPLYDNDDPSPQYKSSVDKAVNAWLGASFPAEKLVMGIPFYGYLYSSVSNSNNGMYQTFGGSSSIGYQDIKDKYLNKPGYTSHFHSQSMVPWLFNGTIFISYEDPKSIGYKSDYIKSKKLGGAMVWELSQDPKGELLSALYHGLKQ